MIIWNHSSSGDDNIKLKFVSVVIPEKMAIHIFLVHVQIFFLGGGWQAVSLEGGVTVMEKREILAGWVTKVCLKMYKKAGVGSEGDI